jgi:response regulator RpfG family c-di-GMP phosphodiesterase
MSDDTGPRVLCVDDEPRVLEGLSLHLGRRWRVFTATSGSRGLEELQESGPFAVVISDMRMPVMNGAAFLAEVRRLAPDTVRMLLTGMTDVESAIAAVNQGAIFRFLSKPCSAAALLDATAVAIEQHRLVTGERELLEKTLMGSLAMLGDVLALASPEAFGRATRIRNTVRELAAEVDCGPTWEVESAAILSQVGYITLAEATSDKLNHGLPLTIEEERTVAGLPQVAAKLLAHIPRLEGVRAILHGTMDPAAGERTSGGAGANDRTIQAARILRIALDFDRLDGRGLSLDAALETMMSKAGRYDAGLLSAFTAQRRREGGHDEILVIPLSSITVGMVLAEDVRTASGVLLAARSYVVTEAFVERILNSERSSVAKPVRCLRAA